MASHEHPGGLGRLKKDDPRDVAVGTLQALEAAFTPQTTLQNLADDSNFDFWSIYVLWRYINSLRAGQPPGPQPPEPLPTSKTWDDPRPTLNQGHTNHCVGNGCAQWGNTSPVNEVYTEDDAARIYYAAKVIDGDPGGEDGSYVRSGMKVLQDMKRVAVYVRPASMDDLVNWILGKGPVTVGTDWYESMFTLDGDDRARIDDTVICPETRTPVAGGHCYLILGYDPDRGGREFEALNSWGATWGANGHFFLSRPDLQRLIFSEGGEAWLAEELPLASASPASVQSPPSPVDGDQS
jgi:Papain family cysteine protease